MISHLIVNVINFWFSTQFINCFKYIYVPVMPKPTPTTSEPGSIHFLAISIG